MPERMSEYMSDRLSLGGLHSRKVIVSYIIYHLVALEDHPTYQVVNNTNDPLDSKS